MSEDHNERLARQGKNWQWRFGPNPPVHSTTWELSFEERVIMEQALDERSQFEWFAKAEPEPSQWTA